jgi:ferric-dicitrate binding protein FerR (iron transport regulator)
MEEAPVAARATPALTSRKAAAQVAAVGVGAGVVGGRCPTNHVGLKLRVQRNAVGEQTWLCLVDNSS